MISVTESAEWPKPVSLASAFSIASARSMPPLMAMPARAAPTPTRAPAAILPTAPIAEPNAEDQEAPAARPAPDVVAPPSSLLIACATPSNVGVSATDAWATWIGTSTPFRRSAEWVESVHGSQDEGRDQEGHALHAQQEAG